MNLAKLKKSGIAGAITYAALKAIQNSTDPYTRAAIGSAGAVGVSMYNGADYKYITGGVFLVAMAQMCDITKGGKIVTNRATFPIYVLHETQGIIKLQPGQTPNYGIDGFTFKGLNGVIKLCDGVYCRIYATGRTTIRGFGAVVNKIHGGGIKTRDWCQQQPDKRWMELLEYGS